MKPLKTEEFLINSTIDFLVGGGAKVPLLYYGEFINRQRVYQNPELQMTDILHRICIHVLICVQIWILI